MFAAPAAPKSATPAKPAAEKPELTILYGDDHAFGISVPAGWTVDDSSGMGSKIRVVLYPKGEQWATAHTVMYVNPIHQPKPQRRTLRQMIESDIAQFRKNMPRGTVTTQAPLPAAESKQAEVRYFSPDGREVTEAVAYVPEDDLVMLLVLQSRTGDGFRRSLPAFRALVASYRFIIAGIQTPK